MASLYKRETNWYVKYPVAGRTKRVSLRTNNKQIAREKVRQIESAQLRGTDDPLPSRTPVEDILTAYVRHIRTIKTPKSAQTDVYYLRQMFGPICPALKINSRRPSPIQLARPNVSRHLRELSKAPLKRFSEHPHHSWERTDTLMDPL